VIVRYDPDGQQKGEFAMSQNHSKRQKILIVDDSEINRSILADILEAEYDILEAADGVEAIDLLQHHAQEISAVLLDILMPRKNGFEVLTEMNQRGWIEEIPVIIISAETGSKQVEQAYNLGATDFISRPFDAMIVHRRVVNTVLLYSKQRKLLDLVVEQINEKERLSNIMVDILSHIVEFRNGESGQHIIHIRAFTEVMLRQLQRMTDRYPLKKDDIVQISLAASLHDIGKIAIDEKILNKPGRLTPEEFEIMKTHSLVGSQMLERLPDYQDTQLVRTAWEICRWHHERYDGRGYPDGLKGDEIPISAQMVALADVYDALISDRCYKKAFSHEKAIQMILGGECGAFNPLLLDCLRQVEGLLNTEFTNLRTQEKHITHDSLVRELFHGENAFASPRSLHLIEQERMDYEFFSAASDEMQFKYIVAEDKIKFPTWAAEKLGVEPVVFDPRHNERLRRIMGDSCPGIRERLAQCQPDEPTCVCECLLLSGDSPRWYRLTLQKKWQDGVCTEVIGKAVDIHNVREKITALERRASYDAATELLNLASAREQILERMKLAPDGNFALAIFDLDDFKSINDTYGHIFGNKILKAIADKARNSVRGNDIVARIGGDEFMIFMEYNSDTEIEKVVQRVFRSLVGVYDDIHVTVSLGAVKTSVIGYDYDQLFHAADQALYTSKRGGRCRCLFYDDSMKDTLGVVSNASEETQGGFNP